MAEIPKVILLIETSRAFGRGLLHGIAKYSHLHGPWAFYSEPGGQEKTLPQLGSWGANGIIMRYSKKTKEIIAMGLPTIISVHYRAVHPSEKISNLPTIITDDAAVGKMAAEHLLDRGFRQFACCGFDNLVWSQKRCQSFRRRIEEAGFEVHSCKQPRTKVQRLWENEQTLIADWLKSLPKPLGLMACNDDRARHVIEACKISGLRVPEQVAILGVGNDELVSDLSDPPLSSIAVNTEKAGYEAAELLDKLMAGKKKMANQLIIARPTYVVTKRSTDILAIEEPNIAEAVHYIRQHAKEGIGVEDVVRSTALSRRVLEKRFRKILGRSVYNEIKRCRIEQLTQMLVQTDLSVSQAALAFGFAGADKMCRYFRREKGMSPLTYRKQYGTK